MKILLQLIVITLAAVSFAACGDEGGSELTNGANDRIIIGDLNAYTGFAARTQMYRKGWRLALDDINNDGGVLSRQIKVVSRDTRGNPEDALNIAKELVLNKKAFALMGVTYSHIGLAISGFSMRQKIPFLAYLVGTDKLLWKKNHKYIFRITQPSYVMGRIMADEALSLDGIKLAIISHNYEFGRSCSNAIKQRINKKNTAVSIVDEIYPALNKMDPGRVFLSLQQTEPDIIVNCLVSPDILDFAREYKRRAFSEKSKVVSYNLYPEEQKALGDEFPVGWRALGFDEKAIDHLAFNKFSSQFQGRYGEKPTQSAVKGYIMLTSIAKAIEQAGELDREKFVDRFRGMTIEKTPIGRPITWRAVDGQSTYGIWVGTTGYHDNGEPGLLNAEYKSGADYLPPRKRYAPSGNHRPRKR